MKKKLIGLIIGIFSLSAISGASAIEHLLLVKFLQLGQRK
jgi:hypothetical protein